MTPVNTTTRSRASAAFDQICSIAPFMQPRGHSRLTLLALTCLLSLGLGSSALAATITTGRLD